MIISTISTCQISTFWQTLKIIDSHRQTQLKNICTPTHRRLTQFFTRFVVYMVRQRSLGKCRARRRCRTAMPGSGSHQVRGKIDSVAKMFGTKTVYVKSRLGERYASALTKISQNNQIITKFGKINLKDYITSFIKNKNL